ncbi:MarC family protein [Suttonella ornithocola]|uniref:UPF0056 membrane protein n=1 Tax=Suttonella ornithocola TaxID=279832 RepID=A0A380MQQ8_9GAMM|nr:MarC family protein [Suttonella ornithocola]SUO94915.1 membrane protein, MarC family [Suttonella ornithocola]
MIDQLVIQFVVLWAVIDPIGSIPVYLAQTNNLPANICQKIAQNATLIAGGILLFFLIAGQFLLEAMKIPLPAFQTAGGIVLLLFALTMIFGESKPDQEIKLIEDQHAIAKELAVFPLAVPSIASPGAMMAIVMLTDNHRFSLSDQAITASIMIVILLITYGLLRIAVHIQRWIGNAGAAIISRVMGLILAAVAVDSILRGIRDFFLAIN